MPLQWVLSLQLINLFLHAGSSLLRTGFLVGRERGGPLVAAHRLSPRGGGLWFRAPALGVWASGVAALRLWARARYCGTQALLPCGMYGNSYLSMGQADSQSLDHLGKSHSSGFHGYLKDDLDGEHGSDPLHIIKSNFGLMYAYSFCARATMHQVSVCHFSSKFFPDDMVGRQCSRH